MIYIFFFCLSETKWFEMAAAFSSRIPLHQLEKGKINCNERIRRAFCFLMDKISVYFAPSASRHSFRKLWGNACAAGEKSCRCSCVFFSKFWWWKQSLSFSYSQWICAVLKNKCCPVYRIRMLLFFFFCFFFVLRNSCGAWFDDANSSLSIRTLISKSGGTESSCTSPLMGRERDWKRKGFQEGSHFHWQECFAVWLIKALYTSLQALAQTVFFTCAIRHTLNAKHSILLLLFSVLSMYLKAACAWILTTAGLDE